MSALASTLSLKTRVEIVRAIVNARQKVLLYGPPGTAKSTTAHEIGVELCGGDDFVYSVTCHEDLSAQELVGMFVPKGGEFVWHDGPALRAWRHGGMLILNEVDKAAGPVWTALYAICDDPRVARLTLPTGELVRPHERFRVVATSNQPVDVLPDALRDRFSVTIPFMEMTEGQLAALPPRLRPVASAAYAEQKYPHITYRKLAAFANIVQNTELSPEQQQEMMKWIFGQSSSEVYNAIIHTTKTEEK